VGHPDDVLPDALRDPLRSGWRSSAVHFHLNPIVID
jgi:hypothetical protein